MIRFLAVLFGLLLIAQQTGAQVRKESQAASGDLNDPSFFSDLINGIVFDRITTMPIPGAQVSVDGNRALKDDLTNENGVFQLTFTKPVRVGTVISIYISKSGYKPRTQRVGVTAYGNLVAEIPLTSENPAPRLKDSGAVQNDTSIFITYLRLFGAFQVPLLLANQYLPQTSDIDEDESAPAESRYRKSQGSIEPQVIAFWRNWEYRNARPIRSRVWHELFQVTVKDTPTELLRSVSRDDERMQQSFLFAGLDCGQTGAGPQYRECPGKYPQAEVAAATKENAAKVGFLSLIIENTSSKNLLDVKLHFREFQKTNGILGDSEKTEHVEEILAMQPEQTQVIPRIRPHESVLWLLSIYLKDEKGYPKRYLSSVDFPTRISFRTDDSTLTQQLNVRKPLMERAAKVVVPYGWYMQ